MVNTRYICHSFLWPWGYPEQRLSCCKVPDSGAVSLSGWNAGEYSLLTCFLAPILANSVGSEKSATGTNPFCIWKKCVSYRSPLSSGMAGPRRCRSASVSCCQWKGMVLLWKRCLVSGVWVSSASKVSCGLAKASPGSCRLHYRWVVNT